MKVYASPVPYPEPDYRNYDSDKVRKADDEHAEKLRVWLKDNGYTGKHSGEIFRTPMADGYACYMLADGRKSFLIHLPYGDAWNCRDVEFLPKREIIRRIETDKSIAALFAKESA